MTTRKVGVYTYTIEEVDDLPEEGICYPDRLLIRIRAGMPPERTQMVLTHELLHALCDYKGLVDVPPEMKERMIEAIAPDVELR